MEEKIPLYNTEKKLGFVDVFWKKIYKLFYKNKNPHRFIDEDSLPVPLFVQLTKKFVFVM